MTEGEWKNLKRYRTLTMGANANITVYGDICVGGQIYSTSNKMNKDMGGPGTPTGNYGCIDMKSGGKITLESGSILYAWGFITGQNKDEGNNTTGVGTIEAKSGSTVYEDFVIGDWHGGGQTLSWYIRNRSYFFPFNQYFVPNIEVPLILDYGAKENTYSNIYVSKNKIDLPINNFITKDNGLFNIKTSGSYIKKWYDSTTDEQSFEFAGDVSIGSLSFKYNFVGIDSKDCVLPLTSNMKMIITRGTTLTASNDMCLIPGSKVVIDEDATVNLGGNVYVYDLDDWNGFAYTYQRICYPFRPTSHYTQTSDWTKKDNMEDAKILVNGKLDITGNLYTTNGGADICSSNYGEIYLSKITKPSTTYQASNDLGSKKDISVNAAQLHNGDGSYVKTAEAAAGTTYYYDPNEGKWATTEPASPSFSQSGNHVKLDKAYLLTSGVSVKFANNLKVFATGKNVLSADLTNATGTFDVAAMRTAIGATDDNNVLLYAPSNANVGDAKNVIVNGTAANLVITDKQPIDVPTAFTATNVYYSRANTKNSGDKQWGTICLPFALKSGNGIQYYEFSEIDDKTMKVTEVTDVPANQPAIYSVATGASIEIGGEQVQIATTSEGKYPLTDGKLVLYGVQTAPITLKTDITPSPYYIAQNKFWQPTKNNVTVSPQRAYFISNDKATAKVLSIVEDGETTGISSAETSEPTIVGIYTVGGTKIDNLEKGINIVRMSDGTTKKIILK